MQFYKMSSIAFLRLYVCIISLSMAVAKEKNTKKLNNHCETDQNCPVWAKCNNTQCECKESVNDLRTVHCNKDLQLSVIRCHCVTFDNSTGELVEGNCMENCENGYSKSEYLPLPLNVSQLNQFICEERWNRTGRLCGQCLPGYSPLAYSYDMRCVKCPEGNRNIWKYILVAFGPLTVFYIVVLMLKINATSSFLCGFVIYSQLLACPTDVRIITTLTRHVSPFLKYMMNLLIDMYSIWSLDFFRSLYPEICLNMSTLTVLALDYAVAIYPLFLTVLSYILIELYAKNFRLVIIVWKPFRYLFLLLKKNWDCKATVIDAFATFFLLSFTKVVYISVDLLTPVKAIDLSNSNLSTWVLYYDGTMEYFGREHLPYALLAIVCSTVFAVLPVLLLLIYQFRWFQRLLSCLKLRHPLLQEVMESFQSCYTNGTQPGTKDHRWFSAVYYILRYINVVVYTLTLDSSYYPFGLALLFVTILLLGLIQPYKDINHSKTDILFMGLLGLFLSFNEEAQYPSLHSHTMVFASQLLRIIVLTIPLFIIICFTIYKVLSKTQRTKLFISRVRALRRGYTTVQSDSETDIPLPDRMINPGRYKGRYQMLLSM